VQHFSNYFAQIVVIKSKCWGGGGKNGLRWTKKISGGAAAPLPPTSRAYGVSGTNFRNLPQCDRASLQVCSGVEPLTTSGKFDRLEI